MMNHIPKPDTGEYIPYADAYISLLPQNCDIPAQLRAQCNEVLALARSITEQQLRYRYAEGKWSIKEVLVHIMDTERIFAYRALRIARNDKTPLPGYEQDDYVLASGADDREAGHLLAEYEAIRKATILFIEGLVANDMAKSGTANGHAVSVRALFYQIAGHELHHLNIIKERYLQ